MKQRRRRKLVKLRQTVQVDDPTGFLAAMTSAERTAWLTRVIRKTTK